MKPILMLTFSAFSAVAVQAQITVTSDWIATLGDTVILSEDTVHASSLDLGFAAGNQSWDFTVLEEHKPDGAILEHPSTAPFHANFPTATFVVNDLTDDSAHVFFRQTAAYLEVVGLVEYDSTGNPVMPEFDVQWRYMEFPSTMGSLFVSSNFIGTQVQHLGVDPDSLGPHPTIDSLRNKFYFESHSEIDAWGELELPQGTFLAVRQHVWNRVKISGDWYGNGTWQPYTPFMLMFIDSVQYDTADEATYRWWSDNPAANFWIAEVEVDSTGNPMGSVSYLKGGPDPYVGIEDVYHSGFAVYPNPASGSLTVETNVASDWRVDLYDTQARKVLHHQTSGIKTVVDISTLQPGAYLVQVSDARGRIARMEKIQVVH